MGSRARPAYPSRDELDRLASDPHLKAIPDAYMEHLEALVRGDATTPEGCEALQREFVRYDRILREALLAQVRALHHAEAEEGLSDPFEAAVDAYRDVVRAATVHARVMLCWPPTEAEATEGFIPVGGHTCCELASLDQDRMEREVECLLDETPDAPVREGVLDYYWPGYCSAGFANVLREDRASWVKSLHDVAVKMLASLGATAPPLPRRPRSGQSLADWATVLTNDLRPWLPELGAARARWTETRTDTGNAKTLRQIWQDRAAGKKTWHGITYATLKGDRYSPSRRADFPKPKVTTGKGAGSGNLYDPDEIEAYVKNRPDRRRV